MIRPEYTPDAAECVFCGDEATSGDLCHEHAAMHRIAGGHVRECDCALCAIRSGIEFARDDRRAEVVS